MQELIILLMQSRTLIHTLHLKSTFLSEHLALEDLYNSLNNHIDSLTETYQGLTCELLNLDLFPEFASNNGSTIEYIKDINEQITCIRIKMTIQSSVIQNIIDELQKSFYTTIYKLTFLK